MSIRQQKCSEPLGAVRTHMLSGGLAPRRRASRASASCTIRAPERPVVLEALARASAARSSAGTAARAPYGAISTVSSSMATIRSRRRTSSWTRSPSRLPPIVRVA